jgi:2-(1,2-epoxy-1,2-dihydrophenyl)acetyl-CoA isomerase
MSATHEPFLIDRTEGVLKLSFNRPEQGNAIPRDAVSTLTALFTSISEDPAVRVMLVRGEGTHFSSGGNIRDFAQTIERSVAERRADFGERLDAVKAMVEAYLAIEVPIVAACQGAVAGAGLMFALGADYVLADGTVTFMFSHQRIGLPPDGGVSLLLPRVVGERRAAELILTAARVGSAEAYRIGLVSHLVDDGQLLGAAEEQARRFARAPVGAVRGAKRLIAASRTQTASEQLLAERDAIVEAVGEADFAEGVRAFLERRQPAFPSTLSSPTGSV